MPPFKGFIGGSLTGQSLTLESQRTVNLYVEPAQGQGAAGEGALLPTPGFAAWSFTPDVGAHCFATAGTRLFGMMGSSLYEFDINGTATHRSGVMAVDGNPAQIVYNGVVGGQLGIAAGGNIYSYDLTTNNPPVARLSGGYTHLAYAGGYGLAFQATTGKVFLSALNDLTSWSAGQFFQRSLFADPWQAMWVDANNLVWLPGTETFEVWNNTGVGTQPFAPLSGLVGRYGIAAPFAFGAFGKGNCWLARSQEGVGEFVITRGSAPQSVSTYALSSTIAGYLRTSRIDDAETLIYQQEGHTFAVVSFPAAGRTWAYDVDAQSWAERGQWLATHGDYGVWAPRAHAYAFGKHIVGDRGTGQIWRMDTSIATDIDGAGIRRLRRSPHLNVEHQRIPIDTFELHLDLGKGLASGQGSAPLAMLRVSQDGGNTWGNERTASVGRISDFRKRAYWTRLGAAADAVMEVTYSEPTPFRVVGAFLNNAERAA